MIYIIEIIRPKSCFSPATFKVFDNSALCLKISVCDSGKVLRYSDQGPPVPAHCVLIHDLVLVAGSPTRLRHTQGQALCLIYLCVLMPLQGSLHMAAGVR